MGATTCQLGELRREKWEELLAEVYEFCDKNDIFKLKWEMNILTPRSGCQNLELQTNITIK
jgi:hypothetical protein